MEGRLVRSPARIERIDAIAGKGAQRKEIKRHIEKIASGIREGVQVPNPVLLVLLDDSTVVVEPGDDETDLESFTIIRPVEPFTDVTVPGPVDQLAQRSRTVEIEFPFRFAMFDNEKVALVVDGQQRTAALAYVPLDEVPAVSLTVIATIGDGETAQEIFAVANDTVKIASDLSKMIDALRKQVPAGKTEDKIKAEACRILAVTKQTRRSTESRRSQALPPPGDTSRSSRSSRLSRSSAAKC